MLTFRELVTGFRELGLQPGRPVLVHASLSSFGEEIRGGSQTVLGALLTAAGRLMAPNFTYKTMLIPETGPKENALQYGSGADSNRMAEFFVPGMPADPSMGRLAEDMRCHPLARRSAHPILSFAAIGLEAALQAQNLTEPLSPIRVVAEMGGEVVLIGVDQRVNTALHYAERLAGRKQFLRWALTPSGVVACAGFPGCSEGFNQIIPHIAGIARQTRIGLSAVQAIPLSPLIRTTAALLRENPLALLCDDESCERCAAVRAHVAAVR